MPIVDSFWSNTYITSLDPSDGTFKWGYELSNCYKPEYVTTVEATTLIKYIFAIGVDPAPTNDPSDLQLIWIIDSSAPPASRTATVDILNVPSEYPDYLSVHSMYAPDATKLLIHLYSNNKKIYFLTLLTATRSYSVTTINDLVSSDLISYGHGVFFNNGLNSYIFERIATGSITLEDSSTYSISSRYSLIFSTHPPENCWTSSHDINYYN